MLKIPISIIRIDLQCNSILGEIYVYTDDTVLFLFGGMDWEAERKGRSLVLPVMPIEAPIPSSSGHSLVSEHRNSCSLPSPHHLQ